MNLNKTLILSIVLLLTSFTLSAQFSNNNREKKLLQFAVGGGIGIVDPGNIMGGNIMLEMRKPIALIAKDYSLSVNIAGNTTIGDEAETFGLLTLNFNAFSQATKVHRHAFGGFVGLGLMIAQPRTKTKSDGTSTETGMIGAALTAGPRFKLGSAHMDIRGYVGVVMSNPSLMNAGLNLMFTFGMNKKGRSGMQ